MPALMMTLKKCLVCPSACALAQMLYTRRHAHRIQAHALEAAYADVIKDATQLHRCSPVVYSALYNISFFGLEKLHPFDSAKFAKVAAALKKQKLLPEVCLLASLLLAAPCIDGFDAVRRQPAGGVDCSDAPFS